MPVVLLKNATKHLQEGFLAARQRLSIGSGGGRSMSSFSDRGDRARKSKSFDECSDALNSSMPALGFPHPIAELSKELDEEPSTELGPRHFVSAPRQKEGQPKVRFTMFRKKRSDVSDLSMDDAAAHSRMSSFLGRGESDISNASSGGGGGDDSRPVTGAIFRRKKSDLSADGTAGTNGSPSGTPSKKEHSRIPGVLRMSLSALKRGSADSSDHKHGREDS